MKKKMSRIIVIGLVMALCFGSFAGCGNNDSPADTTAAKSEAETKKEETTKAAEKTEDSPATSAESAQDEPPTPISLMVQINFSEVPSAENELELMMEEYSNTDLDIIWVPLNNYNEKVNLAITSNELPNAISILQMKAPVFVNAVRSGMFWDVQDKIEELPALSENYDPNMLHNASIDGKLYGLPRGRPLTRNGIIMRKDWLENAGITIEQPITMDGIYEVIKALAENDPDGNGEDDTYGILGGVDENGRIQGPLLEMMDVAFGGGNRWELQDGKIIPTFDTPVHMETLNFIKKLYDEGLMNQDFATVMPSQFYELLDKEKAGFFFQTLTDAHERLDNVVKVVQERDPVLSAMNPVDAKVEIFDTIYQIEAPDGTIRACTQDGFNGLWAFPKTSNKTEEDLMKVLHFFDTMDTPDGQSIIYWGKEGVHWDYEDGLATMTADSMLFSREVQPYWQLFCTNRVTDRSSIKGYVAPMYTKVYGEMESLLPYAVFNPVVPLVSDTYTNNGASLDKIINDAEVQYIMGIIDKAGWDAAVEQWHSQGGDKMIEEYTDAYNQINA